ncbi:MAG: Kdo hydroxylase family protein [Acidiferrobacter sp.]
MEPLQNIDRTVWAGPCPPALSARATAALEAGQVLLLPQLAFVLTASEQQFLDPCCSDGRAKNISFDPKSGVLKGAAVDGALHQPLKAMIERYAHGAQALVAALLPGYAPHLRWGRTSYRPVNVEARVVSARKDDSRLHVDAFPTRPNGGARILRVFCNVNPAGGARVWRLGEPFESCARRFLPQLSRPWPGSAWLLKAAHLTRSYRTRYDHYMLALHNVMKADDHYQRFCPQSEVPFPPASTWIVFTDQVSHAAMAGQYLFEQTFHMPPAALREPATAPVRVLERLMGRRLIPVSRD